jgi:site-specific DNA recombinase
VRRLDGQRVAIYARYSTDRQNPRSIEDQVRLCSERVRDMGGSVAQVFSDAAISGAIDVRPGLDALKAAARSGQVDVIVCEDMSRIGRDTEHVAGAMKRFASWGARLIALNDGVDTAHGGKLLGRLKAVLGEEALDEIRARTRRGMQGCHEQGRSTGGRAYGYRAADGARVIDEREAAIVRRIFELHIAGVGQREIAERLNADGVQSARGGKWAHTAVRAVVRNPLYTGVVLFGQREWSRDVETGRRRYKHRETRDVRRRVDPSLAIIDAETWEAAQSRVRAVAGAAKQHRRGKRGYPLSGLLACDVCGSTMTLVGSGRYYRCSSRQTGKGCANGASLAEVAIRGWLIEQVIDGLGTGAVLDGLREEIARTFGDHDRKIRAELQERRGQLSRTETAVGKLYDLMAEGTASPTLRAKIREREDHAELQRAAIAALEHRLGRVPVLPSRDQLSSFLRELPRYVAEEPSEARAVLGKLCAGPVRCRPPERRGEPYWADVTLRADGLIASTTAAGAVVSHLVVAGAGFVQIRHEIHRAGPVAHPGAARAVRGRG